jgi:hypothetical protein
MFDDFNEFRKRNPGGDENTVCLPSKVILRDFLLKKNEKINSVTLYNMEFIVMKRSMNPDLCHTLC